MLQLFGPMDTGSSEDEGGDYIEEEEEEERGDGEGGVDELVKSTSGSFRTVLISDCLTTALYFAAGV